MQSLKLYFGSAKVRGPTKLKFLNISNEFIEVKTIFSLKKSKFSNFRFLLQFYSSKPEDQVQQLREWLEPEGNSGNQSFRTTSGFKRK